MRKAGKSPKAKSVVVAASAMRCGAGKLTRGIKLPNKSAVRRSNRLASGRPRRQVITRWVAGSAAPLSRAEYHLLPSGLPDESDEDEMHYGASKTPMKESILREGDDVMFASSLRSPPLVHCGVSM